ncbi:MAG: hypothetical protein AB1521_16575 [Bacteroidota bacterium]
MCELFDKIFSDSSVFLNFVIAFATFSYMIFTVLMWLSMKKSINLTKQNFELSNRPFIGVTEFGINFVDNGHLNPFFRYINFGNVPAKEIVLNLSIEHNSEKIFYYKSIMNNVFPSNTSMWAEVFETDYKSMISPTDDFTLAMNISYNGVTNTRYSTKELYKYDYASNSFSVIESKWD